MAKAFDFFRMNVLRYRSDQKNQGGTVCWLYVLIVALLSASAQADDWPQWMGPNRDGIYRETGIVENIPTSGLQVLWRQPIGSGYAGPAVSSGRVFVPDYVLKTGTNSANPSIRDPIDGLERLVCLDVSTGKQLWKHEYSRPYKISYGNGPRATPTVDGERVYMLGAEGDLWCLSTSDGKVLWSRQLSREYKSETPIWGHAAHPLVRGNVLYVLAGGTGSVVVALDKMTGQERWRALSASEMGYCPPTLIKHDEREQLIIWHAESINSLDPDNGTVLWSTPLKPSYGMSIAAPRQSGNRLFASGIGEKGAMFELLPKASGVKTVWEGAPKKALYSGNSTPLFDGEMIYGSDCGGGAFIAVNAVDGSRAWETLQPTSGGTRRASHGTAFVVKRDDRYLLFSEKGDLIIAKLSPQKYEELGRFHVLEPTSDCFDRKVVWSHPAYANRCMFARNDKEIVCVSLAKQ